MDVWIISFIVLTIVVFLVSFTIPQLGRKGGPRKKKVHSSIPKPVSNPMEFTESELVAHDDTWDIGGPDEGGLEDEMSIKGLRIAWKQFNSELSALIKDASNSGQISFYHKNKYEELNNFYTTSLEMHSNMLSEQDQVTIKDKLARAKRLIERY